MSSNLKIICALALLAAWGALVAAGLTPVEPFIQTLRETLLGLGVVSVALTTPGGPKS